MLARKWLFIGIFTALISGMAVADPPAVHPTTGEPLTIECLRGTPEAIDGDLSDWNLAAMTPAVLDSADQIYTGSWGGPEDVSGEFYVLWDDVNFYVAAIVHDDALSMTKTGGDIWNADCVEFFLSTLDHVPSGTHTGHYQWGMNANEQKWEWEDLENWTGVEPEYMQMVSTLTDDGYICEAALQYASITSFDWTVGNTIGFHPCIDDTEATDREIQMTWTGLEAHDQSTGFGHMFLSDQQAIAKELARDPSPENEAIDVPLDATLSWTPGAYAAAHDVYLGTSFDDVNDGTTPTNPGQNQTTYDPGLLDYGQTYYWRIDEVNGAPDNTVFKGTVWSFTTELLAYPIGNVTATSNVASEANQGPDNTINGSGLNANDEHSTEAMDMWLATPDGADLPWIQYEFDSVYKLHEMLVWNYNSQFELILGFGLKDVTVEYSENGTDWTVLGDVELARGAAAATYTANTAVEFGDVAAKYVRLTTISGHGMLGQYGLSEVRFLAIPVNAREPQPADGAVDVDVTSALAWRAGRDAAAHDVYLGTDPDALALAGNPGATSYNPGTLDLGTTYYWKVDETSGADGLTWGGSLWSFATQEYLVVDDFESYNDEDNVIYETWIDGWINETGSTVGYLDSPFAEQTIVHSGRQSMPLFYENSNVATAEADLALNQDWTASGIQSLALYFQGDPTNSGGQLFVTINNTTISYDGPGADLTGASWQSWNIDLSAVGGLNNVTSLTIGVEGSGASGVVYIDDIRLYPRVIYPDVTGAGDTVVGVPNDGDWPAAETPDLAVDDDTATKYLHFKGETEPTGLQITPAAGATIVTGITFTTANDAPERDPVAFELYGANDSIDGPYTLIASGDIVDFAGETEWPRFTANATGIAFDNDVAYAHYQVLFPAVRDPGSANSMQIAEVELLGTTP